MSYTLNLISWAVNTFVPFGDQLPIVGNKLILEKEIAKQICQLKLAQNRLKSIQTHPYYHADSSLKLTEEKVRKQIKNLQRDIAENEYANATYTIEEVQKGLNILIDVVMPGASIAVTTLVSGRKAFEIPKFVKKTEAGFAEIFKKSIQQVALPILLSGAYNYLKHEIDAYLVPGAGLLVGGALSLDAFEFNWSGVPPKTFQAFYI